MAWSLINELGVDFGSAADEMGDERLCFPTHAARATDGTYLIAEELGIEKQVPFRFECRTIRVTSDHEVLFDSQRQGISDGHGCLLHDGSLALLRRTKWELLIYSPQGEVSDRLKLASFSKRIPRYVHGTPRGTLIVVFYNRSGEVDIIELDRGGQLLWFYPAAAKRLGIVGSVQWTASDTLLLADPFRHVVMEIARDGTPLWQYGADGNPARSATRLASPTSLRLLKDGRRLVADTRNHRLLAILPDGSASEICCGGGRLCEPVFADETDNGHMLVCDAGNARVIEIDNCGEIIWEYGNRRRTDRCLSFPRSVDVIGGRDYLVADTAHDRIVEFIDGRCEVRTCDAEPPLFWPRCVRRLAHGGLLVADARNGRILEVERDGTVARQLTEIRLDRSQSLLDPHDVRLLGNGNLLVTDSSHDLVVEVGWCGKVYCVIGATSGKDSPITLSDPHSAQLLEDGTILISDTGNHRILIVGRDGQLVREIRVIRSGPGLYKLHLPRYAESTSDGTLVIADTGNNRILAATLSGDYLWHLDSVPSSRIAYLNQPRWATLVNNDEVVVCDHFHHRLVHLKRETVSRRKE